MALDDNVPIAPVAPASTAAPMLVKTFRVTDSTGAVVEVQAVAVTDADGRTVTPLSEDTGQQILAALRSINNLLAAGAPDQLL
jgi:photosystem II stability/assembly factor-like uncharacterized protein